MFNKDGNKSHYMKRKTILNISLIVIFIIITLYLIQLLYFDKLVHFGGYSFESMSAMEYYIILDKEGNTSCINPLGYQYKARKLIYISGNGSIDTLCIGEGTTVIESYVEDVIYNTDFILVDQKPLDSICEFNDLCAEKKYNNWHNLPTYQISLNALKESKIHKYWIIEKNKDYVYGPLTKEEFLRKKRELKVPKNLKLKLN